MKIKAQQALAPLTSAEREHIAKLLCDHGRTYSEVRDLLARPRSQGGYDLPISIKPLQVLHERETQRRLFLKDSPQHLTLDEFIDLRNGAHRPETRVGQAFIQKRACRLAMDPEADHKPSDLLVISRVFNIPHLQQITRKRHQLALRRQALAEKRLQSKPSLPAELPPSVP